MPQERIRFHVNEGASVVAVVSAPTQESFRIARWLERVSGQRTPGAARELDRAAAAAEQVAAALLAASLSATGVPAVSLRADEAGLVGEGEFGAGSLSAVETPRLRELAADGLVAVVTGGQVQRADGEIVMLRSRSADVIAVALAEGARCAMSFHCGPGGAGSCYAERTAGASGRDAAGAGAECDGEGV